MSRHVRFYTNKYGSNAWVYDPGSLPPWRSLRTGEFAGELPSGMSETSASELKSPGQYSYLSEYFTPAPAPAPTSPSRTGTLPMDPGLRAYVGGGTTAPTVTTPEESGFREPKLSDSTYDLIDEVTGKVIGRNVALFNAHYQEYLDFTAGIGGVGGVGGGGPTGPTAAELAIERSKVDAQNLATFISGTMAELELEIDAKRLTTEQALGEFNRRLDAFSEAGKQFKDIQPYTIPKGAEYAPGFQPGGIGERLGIEPVKAQPIEFDPFAMATDIVNETPVLTDIGVPSGDALKKAVELARGFIG